jgi:hypothetical protein
MHASAASALCHGAVFGVYRRVTRQRPRNGGLRCWRSRRTRLHCPNARAKSLPGPCRDFRASRCPLRVEPPDADHGFQSLVKRSFAEPPFFFPCARTDAEQTLAKGKYTGPPEWRGEWPKSGRVRCFTQARSVTRARLAWPAAGGPDGMHGGRGGGGLQVGV